MSFSHSISIALPCYNEEENIADTIADICTWFNQTGIEGEVVAVNDGSADRTGEILEELKGQYPQLVVVHHDGNKGYGTAVRTGLDACTKDYIGFTDSDGQFHAEDFSRLLPLLLEVDFATGFREERADPFVRKCNAWLYGTLVRILLGVKTRDLNCAMKLWKRDLWQQIRPRYSTGALINAEMYLRLKEAGHEKKEVSVPHYPRTAGEQTGANIGVILKMFRDLGTLKKKFRNEK